MKKLNIDSLRNLAHVTGETVATICFPTERSAEWRQNPTHLKNARRELEPLLAATGLNEENVAAWLKPLEILEADDEFWRHCADGLALFGRNGEWTWFATPYPLPVATVATTGAYLKPLLPSMALGDAFHVLVPDQNEVRFFEGGPRGLEAVTLDTLPDNLEEALGNEEFQKNLQAHSVRSHGEGGGPAQFHGHGGPKDEQQDQARRFYRTLDAAVCQHLNAATPPLLIVATPEQFALYREISRYANIVDPPVKCDLHRIEEDTLLQAGRRHLQEQVKELRVQAADNIQTALAQGKASTDLDAIAVAACQGRVDNCIVDLAEERWGIYDETKAAIESAAPDQPCARDLINLIATQTLAHGGQVYPADNRAAIPEEAPAAALLRH